MKTLLAIPKKVLVALFGRISWVAPAWLSNSLSQLSKHPKSTGVVALLIILGGATKLYLDQLPEPTKIVAKITQIQPTADYQNAKPDNLIVNFAYELREPQPIEHDSFSVLEQHPIQSATQQTIADVPQENTVVSVARIDQLDQVLKQGIKLSPHKPGEWRWQSDNQLVFIPQTDWPAGVTYEVEFSKSLFTPETDLRKNSYKFTTPELKANFVESVFYQEPVDNHVKKVIATLSFSHPIEKGALESKISLTMPATEGTEDQQATFGYQLHYAKNRRQVTIHSDPIELPKKTNYMHITLDEGVRSIFGGKPTAKKANTKVKVPDRYSYLKVESNMQILRDPQDVPQQVITLEFTDEMSRQEIKDNLQLYLLPKQGLPRGQRHWQSPRQVSDAVLAASQELEFKLLENSNKHAKHYSLVVDAPPRQYVYLRLKPRFRSVNQFVHQQAYDQIFRLPTYPKEVSIVGEGAILSYSGNHKLSVLSRGVSALQYKISRIKQNQLHHLVSQSQGDISSPSFSSWSFNEENLSEVFTRVVSLNATDAKDANYSSFDFSQYLTDRQHQYGLFVVEISGYDASRQRAIYGVMERRLVLITDLGIIVKNNQDSSHDLFVQSVKSGQPVANATVKVLAKNGAVLINSKTSQTGHIKLPKTAHFKNEKRPVVYVVQTDRDTSFIPFDRYSRQLQMSRFDVGGVNQSQNPQRQLNSFIFSDRGIYRPGETVNLGLITKTNEFSNIEGIPVELIIRGPRYREVRVQKLRIAKNGLNDFQFDTLATSDTGDYRVSLHLVRDRYGRGAEIGSTRFRIEEFQPDTMKITSRLLDVPTKGWTTNSRIAAKVSLKNLFGAPAQNRKVSAKVKIQPVRFKFDRFSEYEFGQLNELDQNSISLDNALPEQLTNSEGNTEFSIDLDRFSKGTYRLSLLVEGFEPSGGRSVTARSSALISPFESLVGHKSDGDLSYIHKGRKRNLTLLAINSQLEKIELQNLTIATVELSHVSSLVKQPNGIYQYQNITKQHELSRAPLTIEQTQTSFPIATTNAGDYKLIIYDQAGTALTSINYTVVGAGNHAGKIDRTAELQVRLNKKDYLPGEEVEINIVAPYVGAGLITIETDRVLRHQWFQSASKSSLQKIKLPDNIEGNGYINVTFLRDASSTEIFTNPLSFAVQPFSIDRSKRKIEVKLTTQPIARPGKPMTIKYKTNQSAKVLVFAVDEGILQVANYTTPDPLGHYMKKRALAVETYQMLDLLLPDFDLLKRFSAAGGGDAARSLALAKNLNPFSRKTDQPAVFWSGIIDSKKTEGQVTFDIPNTFAGQLRVMAVAVGESAVGATQTNSLVRGPFVLSPNVVTHVAPGDEFSVTLGVANLLEGSGEDAPVLVALETSSQLQIISEPKSQLKLSEGDEGKVSFRLKAKESLGAATLTFSAKLGQESLSRTASISVRPASHFFADMQSGFSDDEELIIDKIRTTYSEFSDKNVSASYSPLVIVDGLHDYLASYPHGCTEQVVSKVFPLVGLMSHPKYSAHLGDVRNQFSVVINKLRERQQSDGGFAFWPSHAVSSSYPSIYVSHFLLEASQQGFPVPRDMLGHAKRYLNQQAAQSSQDFATLRNRANAIYLLTRLGEVTTNYLIDLEDDLNTSFKGQWSSDILASYMAATYKMLQKDQEAERLIGQYQMSRKIDYRDASQFQRYGDFHSALALDAQYVYLLAKHFSVKAKALDAAQIHALTQPIFSGDYNTISASYAILALGAYSQTMTSSLLDEKIEISGKEDSTSEFKLLENQQAAFVKSEVPENTSQLKLVSEQAFYYLLSQSGFSREPSQNAIRQGLEIERVFVDDSGQQVSQAKIGQVLNVNLRIRSLSKQAVSNVAIVDLLPGGFEVERSSIEKLAQSSHLNHFDIREDRVVFYARISPSILTLSYQVKVTAEGTFTLPTASAEAMYNRNLRAVTKPGVIKVVGEK